MKKKEVASKKSSKASHARASRQSLKKVKGKGGKVNKGKAKKSGDPKFRKDTVVVKEESVANSKEGIVREKKNLKNGQKKTAFKKGAKEEVLGMKKASDAPKMKLKRPLTTDEMEALKSKKGTKYWDLYKEMRKQFQEDKAKFDRMEAIGKRAKILWEVVRNSETDAEERAVKAKELYRLVRGRVLEIIKMKDLSRVLECLMQHGDVEIRAGLFEELKNEIPNLSKLNFAHFFVLKVLKYGSKDQREYVMSSFRGMVPELMNHKIAAVVVESAYNDWANATQRGLFQQEFYSSAYGQFKDTSITSLEKALGAEGADKQKILEYMREKLDPIIDKQLVQYNLIQTLLWEYLTHCDERSRAEMIDNLKELLIHMIHTREGTRVAMHCIWNTNAKDRKAIMKSWKTHVSRIAKEEHGYLALIAMLDSVDDTKALDKWILRELMTDVHDVALNEVGRKVILYLTAPRDTRYCHPQVLNILTQGDSNPFSKKEMNLRHEEIRKAVSKDLLTEVCTNIKRYVAENSATLVARAVLQNCEKGKDSGDLIDQLHSELADLIAVKFEPIPFVKPKKEENEKRGKKRKSNAVLEMDSVLPEFLRVKKENNEGEEDPEMKMHIIERPATHMLIQKLLIEDAKRGSFAMKILKSVDEANFNRWLTCNRGCFVILEMLKSTSADVQKILRKRLQAFKSTAKQNSFKGAELLLKELKT